MNKKTLLFCLIVGLFWFSLYIYMPGISTYAVDLGSGLSLVGVITGSYGFMQMLLRIPIGITSDRFGKRRPFIYAGIACAALSGVIVCLIATPASLLASRIFAGAAAAAWVPFSVQFSLYFQPEEGPKAMGIINAVNSLGQVVAVLLCGVISSFSGYKTTFFVAAAVGSLSLILSFFLKEPELPASCSHTSSSVKLKIDRGLLLLSLLGLISQFMAFATVYGFTPIIAKSVHATDFEIGLLLTVFILPAIFSSYMSGGLDQKFGGKKVLTVCFLVFGLDCLLTPFLKEMSLLYLTTSVGGFAQGLIFSLLMGYIVKLSDPYNRSSVMGIYQAVYGLGMFLGPLIVGFFSSRFGFIPGFAFTAVVGFLAAFLSFGISDSRNN